MKKNKKKILFLCYGVGKEKRSYKNNDWCTFKCTVGTYKLKSIKRKLLGVINVRTSTESTEGIYSR